MDPSSVFARALSCACVVVGVSAADVIDDSLRFRFNFDAAPAGDVIVDSSPAAEHPGTNVNAVWVSEELGRSGVMEFSGLVADRITVPAIPALNSPVGTISFWIKTPGASGPGDFAAMIMDRRTTDGDVITITDAGNLFVQARQAGQNVNVLTGTALLNDDQWHHVAYVYDQDEFGSISLYVDGVLDATQFNSGGWSWPASEALYFGSSRDSFWRFLDGSLDGVRIYNRILTDEEIAATATGTPVTDTSLVLSLEFAAAPVEDVVPDTSASNNPGTNAGASWAAADGSRNGVMQFDLPAVTQIGVAAAPDLDATTGTISFWMKSDGNVGLGDFASIIFDRRTGGMGDVIAMTQDGSIFVQAQGGPTVNSFSTQGKVNDGAWHHVAYLFDQAEAGVTKIYIDGALSGSGTNSAAWSWPIDQPLEFGKSHDGFWFAFDGHLDDIRFYNRALTEAEITQVGVPPTLRFDVQPISQTVFVGDEVRLRAVANVEATYQWQHEGTNLAGATSDTLVIASAQLSDAGTYAVVAQSALGSGTSDEAELTVVPRPSLEASLMARYPFDEPPANDVIVDVAPGAEHAGTNLFATWIEEVSGRNGVMQFSSLEPGSQMVVPAHEEFNTARGTIAFWMKSAGAMTPGSYGAVLFDRRSDRGEVIVMREDLEAPEEHGGVFVQTYAPGLVNSFVTQTKVNDDQWHHIAYVYDQNVGGSVSVYIDGVLARSNPTSGPWSWDPAQPLEFGKSHDPFWFRLDGYMDDIQIFNRRLNAGEIGQIMNAVPAGPTLTVSRSGSQLTLSWNDVAAVLQERSDLSAAGSWSNVAGTPPSPVQVTVPSTGSKFYRLIKP